MQLIDYIILGIIFICVIAAVVFIIRQKKKGKRVGCGSCYDNCTECHRKQTEKRRKYENTGNSGKLS